MIVRIGGDAYAQARSAFGIALDALERAGAAVDQVVRTRMYVVDREHQPAVARAHGEIFAGIRPVATMVAVGGLIDPALLVEVEVEAYIGPESGSEAPELPNSHAAMAGIGE